MDRNGRGGGVNVVFAIIAVIVAILLFGLFLKLLKLAIIVALAIGIFMFAQNKFGGKRVR
jgi:hypothetical protein